MYAVIKTGGKQYRVQAGDVLIVEKLDGDIGSDVAFKDDIGVWLDQAQRDINRAHPWPSMTRRGVTACWSAWRARCPRT